jgi:hypothetical protein
MAADGPGVTARSSPRSSPALLPPASGPASASSACGRAGLDCAEQVGLASARALPLGQHSTADADRRETRSDQSRSRARACVLLFDGRPHLLVDQLGSRILITQCRPGGDRGQERELNPLGFRNRASPQVRGAGDRRGDDRAPVCSASRPAPWCGDPSTPGSSTRVPSGSTITSQPWARIIRAVSSASRSASPRRTGNVPTRGNSHRAGLEQLHLRHVANRSIRRQPASVVPQAPVAEIDGLCGLSACRVSVFIGRRAGSRWRAAMGGAVRSRGQWRS